MAEKPAGAQARELAQRLTGVVEVILLWHPDVDSVELALRDLETGTRCRIDVAPEHAIDAFYHPYVYATACHDYRKAESELTANDG